MAAFFQRCEEESIQLNRGKLKLRLSQITFFGELITAEGRTTDPEKVKAIVSMPAPCNIEGLRRFLGMCNYLSKYLPHMADVSEPLRNLMKKNVPWSWAKPQADSFNKLKDLVTKAPVLAYFDTDKEVTLENDASDYGLGSALYQKGKPIAFACRTLTETERRYAQIEKEMLAINFGLEKFHYYTFGRPVTVITDHRPLVSIVRSHCPKHPNGYSAFY